MYRILSLDGGGLRGLLTAKLLERLEQAHPGWLARVDLFAGTSTGGILALGLAAGLTPAEIAALYKESAARVFADSFLDDVRDLGKLTGADYSNHALRRGILERIGDITLNDLPRKVLISSFDLDNDPQTTGVLRRWKPKFFHNFPGPDSDGDQRLVDVALRTSAAPTYFPIYQGYTDGGVVVNNPSTCALAQAICPDYGGQSLRAICLLSIGTGLVSIFVPVLDGDWGLAQWAPHLVSLMIEGGVGMAEYQCKQILGRRAMRINPLLPGDIGMDQVERIPLLEEIALAEDLREAIRWLKRYYKSSP
jgi:hypothetical protein